MITLNEFNALSKEEAFEKLEKCCVSTKWISEMVRSRPFSSEQHLVNEATSIWFNKCAIEDFKEAFTGHPKIGNVETLKKKFAQTLEWAENEQAKVTETTIETINALAEANKQYETKFGYIFIVSASGKSAEETTRYFKFKIAS